MSDLSKPSGTRGVAYVRISDGDMQDHARQLKTIKAWAEQCGVTVTAEYKDVEGRNSRDKSDTRKQFQALMAAVKAGQIDWVVVDSLDRWGTAKHDFEFGYFATILLENDCQLWSVLEGHLTGGGAAAAFQATVSSVTAKDELSKAGYRQVTGKRSRASQGEWQGGYVPYGFDVVCVDQATKVERWRVVILKMIPTQKIWHRLRVWPDGTEERCDGDGHFPTKQKWEILKLAPSVKTERIAIVQEIFSLYASGSWTIRGLAARLQERGIDPVTGPGWYAPRLTPLLRNPLYHMGQTVWGKVSHGKNAQYIDGKVVIPKRTKGKVKTGRNNLVTDWVFPPADTALIGKELFDEVQLRLTSNKTNIKKGLRNDSLWLAGLLVCGKCGQRMSGWSQGGLSYACTSYKKFGKTNPYGCKLHRVMQPVLEQLVTQYLGEIAPDIRQLLDTRDNPALLGDVHKRLAERETELWGVFGKMKQYLDAREVVKNGKGDGLNDLNDLLSDYQHAYDSDRGQLDTQLAAAEAELSNLITNINRIPASAKAAIALQRKLISEVSATVEALQARLTPLTASLASVYSDLDALDRSLTAATEAAPGDDARRKALTLRRVVERIVLHFDHIDRPATDRRSKNATVSRSPLVKAEFVPVSGQTFTVAVSPGRGR